MRAVIALGASLVAATALVSSTGPSADPLLPFALGANAQGDDDGDDKGDGTSIDPPFLGQRTTCDQCTIYNFNFWCPLDYSCYVPEAADISDIDNTTQERVREQCNSYCADVYRENHPLASAAEAEAGGVCMDMQQCFYSADQCSDCTLSSGHWCVANRRCYAFESRLSLPEQMNSSDAPSDYICLEDCPDKSCIQKEPQCPACERLRPPLTCGALLPAFVIASTGAGFFVTLIAWFMFSYYHRRRSAQRQAELLEQKRSQRLAAKRAGRAATRGGGGGANAGADGGKGGGGANNVNNNDDDEDDAGSLRFEPTMVNYE